MTHTSFQPRALVLTGVLLCSVGCTADTAVAASPTLSNASIGNARVTLIAEGLEHPWAFACLPPIAGSTTPRALVTERDGRMRIVDVDGKIGAALNGVPKVHAINQGGLLDVALPPQFASNRTIFFSYAEPSNEGPRTVVARGVARRWLAECPGHFRAD